MLRNGELFHKKQGVIHILSAQKEKVIKSCIYGITARLCNSVNSDEFLHCSQVSDYAIT